MEGYFAHVVERLTGAGYRWYETANFCRDGGRDLRSRHNLAYRLAGLLGIGVGAVSTVAGRRWRNTPRLPAYLEALEGRSSPCARSRSWTRTCARERVMLGLRLDELFEVNGEERVLDWDAVVRSPDSACSSPVRGSSGSRRGRFLGGGVSAELLA